MNSINSNSVDFYPKIITDYLSGELKSKNIIDWEYPQDQLVSKKRKRYSSKNRSVVTSGLGARRYGHCGLAADRPHEGSG